VIELTAEVIELTAEVIEVRIKVIEVRTEVMEVIEVTSAVTIHSAVTISLT
jgi:hypothetical protein